MNLNSVRSLILSAAVLTLGAAANAQSNLTAKIPFSFEINGKVLPAGSYHLDATKGSNGFIQVGDLDGGKSVLAIVTSDVSREKSARLVFRCGENTGWVLAEVWSNNGSGWRIRHRDLKPGGKQMVMVIPVHRSDAE